jgi:hypothetical protein
VSLAELVTLLAPALGHEHSQQLVDTVAKQVNQAGPLLTLAQAVELLQALRASQGDKGLISVAARMTQSRLEARRRKVVSTSPSSGSGVATFASRTSRRSVPANASRFTEADVVSLLGPTLGDQRSQDLVGDVVKQLGLELPMPLADVIRLFEALELQRGLVSVVARFAKARLARGS